MHNLMDIIAPYGVLVGWLLTAYVAYMGYRIITTLKGI